MVRATKVIGVLGGMGPAATADFFQKIIRATPARTDQDHLKVVIFSNPHVPDRTAAIRGDGPDPLPELVAGGQSQLGTKKTPMATVAFSSPAAFIFITNN